MKNQFRIDGDAAYILIIRKDGTQLETVVDLADLEKVSAFPGTWYADWNSCTKSFYARIHEPRTSHICKMHRVLLDASAGVLVDHRNHHTLDNRRENLRLADHVLNGINRRREDSEGASGVRGVYWNPVRNLWSARLTVRPDGIHKKAYYFGHHPTIEAAADAVRKGRAEILANGLHRAPRQCQNPQCVNSFVPVVDHQIYCTQACNNAFNYARYRARGWKRVDAA